VTVWVDEEARGGRSFWVLTEDDLEPTGIAESRDGRRVPVESLPAPAERRTTLQLRLATGLTDSAHAAHVAEQIDEAIRDLVGPCRISVEAERHWADPYNYELDVAVEPYRDPVEALQRLADQGEEGWLSCRDDGWRCDLWWSRPDDDDSLVFIVPEVHGAEVAFLPWESPARRPESERPLVAVQVAEGNDDPG
jgi:hypothetical protein